MPLGSPSLSIEEISYEAILSYERLMHKQEFHAVMQLTSEFIRQANKLWSDAIKEAGDDLSARIAVLRDAFYLLKVCTVLMHPITPEGTSKIFAQLGFDTDEQEFFSWDHIFDGFEPFITDEDIKRGGHPLIELPPRTDFFSRHPSQY